MKDGPEVAEGVKTASSATNGGDDKCHMRDLDEQSCRNGVSEVAGDTNALPVGGTLISEDTTTTNGDSDKSGKNGGVPKNGEKQFACRICSRTFGYKHVLQNHERTHTGEKPFECPVCHKRFTRDHHLKTHMRLHTGEKPYQCDHCDKHFVQVANLRRHLRVHTGERPYACQLCESRFSDSNQLKAHMLIHKGEKPFQCLDCLGRFRRRHHLIHHKCPKGDPNLNRSRKGRRPKTYEPRLVSDHEDNEEDIDGDLPPELSDNEENMVDTNNSSSEAEQPSPPSAHSVESLIHNRNHLHNNHHNELLVMSNGVTNGVTNGNNGVTNSLSNGVTAISNAVAAISNGVAAISNGVVTNGNRRKPSRTIRILTPQQRELFIRDKLSMQTQAIDMRLSPSSVEVQPVTVIVPNRFLSTVEGVLDLSSSRSDSEIDVIDDDLRHRKSCDYHIHHPFATRPLSQRIADQKTKILGLTHGLEPLNGSGRTAHHNHSDDSNESHSHLNGGRHLSDDDNSIGAIALTTKKLHVATA